jgi:hypothetical protein
LEPSLASPPGVRRSSTTESKGMEGMSSSGGLEIDISCFTGPHFGTGGQKHTHMANLFSTIATARSANSWWRCSVANVFSAIAAAHSANSWRHCSGANAFSAVPTARLSKSWLRCSAAKASCRRCLSALLAMAFACLAAAYLCCSSDCSA